MSRPSSARQFSLEVSRRAKDVGMAIEYTWFWYFAVVEGCRSLVSNYKLLKPSPFAETGE